MWLFPQVNSVNSHGKKTEWRIGVRVFKYRADIVLPNVPEEAFVPFDRAYLDNKALGEDLRGWTKVDSRIGEGEIRTAVPTITHSGKNLGKKSATNVVCQALRDAYGLHNKQVKKSVQTIATGNTTRYPPMLAQVLRDQKNPPKFGHPDHPLFVQRKYNGVRTVATLDTMKVNGVDVPTVIMYSRRKNLYPGFGYMKRQLLDILQMYWSEGRHLYLDGEVYKHGVALQDISGQSRREVTPAEEEALPKYNYMVYDCFVANEPELKYSERKDLLEEVFEHLRHAEWNKPGPAGAAPAQTYILPVETFRVNSEDEVKALYQQFIKEGYEGAMLRVDVPYVYSYNEKHSKALLKIKPRMDAEFEIVGWTTGEKGKAAGALMIICKTKESIVKDPVTGAETIVPIKEFPVTPALEIAERMELAKKMSEIVPADAAPGAAPASIPSTTTPTATTSTPLTYFDVHYKGKPLIVMFDEWSVDRVPQRASTKMEIRTWE